MANVSKWATLLYLSHFCGSSTILPHRQIKKGLVYPAYPRHFFSLRGLVHICIPHTGTPCGRIIGNRSYWLSWVFPFVGLPYLSPIYGGWGGIWTHIPLLLSSRPTSWTTQPFLFVPLLYHTLRGLSRGFFEKLEFFYSLLLRTVRALSDRSNEAFYQRKWLLATHPLGSNSSLPLLTIIV